MQCARGSAALQPEPRRSGRRKAGTQGKLFLHLQMTVAHHVLGGLRGLSVSEMGVICVFISVLG